MNGKPVLLAAGVRNLRHDTDATGIDAWALPR